MTEPECNGACSTGDEFGMYEYKNHIFPHPDCPLHWDGERCQICGKGYDTVYWLPDGWWDMITPKPENPGAGLLCPDCALVRLLKAHSNDQP